MSEEVYEFLKNESKFNDLCDDAFCEVDTDGSGELDRDELIRCLNWLSSSIGIENPTEEDIDDIYDGLNIDSDGIITKANFKVLVRELLTAVIEEMEKENQS